MTEQALQQYLIKQYPKEDEGCEHIDSCTCVSVI